MIGKRTLACQASSTSAKVLNAPSTGFPKCSARRAYAPDRVYESGAAKVRVARPCTSGGSCQAAVVGQSGRCARPISGAGVRGPARTEKDRFGLGGASPRAGRRGFRRSVQRRLRPRPQTHGNGAVSIACCRAVYSPSWPALLVANGFVYRLGPSSMSYNKEHRP